MSQSQIAPPGGEGVEPVRPLYAAAVAGSDSSPAGKQEKAITIAGYVLLTVVVSCVALMSWTGLVGFGRDTLHMSAPLVWLVPISLDVAAMTCAFLSLRSTVAGDSATGPRLMVLAFVGASAVFNWVHAGRTGSTAAEVFYGGMSLAAAALFDVVLRQVRRHLLRRQHAIERPLPRFRAVRWLRYPKQTYAAWSVAVRDGLTRPDEALAALATVGTPPDAPLALQGASKTDALLIAFGAVGGLDVPAALTWLARQGVTVDRSHAYAIARPLRPVEAPAELPAAGPDSA